MEPSKKFSIEVQFFLWYWENYSNLFCFLWKNWTSDLGWFFSIKKLWWRLMRKEWIRYTFLKEKFAPYFLLKAQVLLRLLTSDMSGRSQEILQLKVFWKAHMKWISIRDWNSFVTRLFLLFSMRLMSTHTYRFSSVRTIKFENYTYLSPYFLKKKLYT